MNVKRDANAHLAAVLLQLGATDDEIDQAWQVMHSWPIPDTPRKVVDDCRVALMQVRNTPSA